MYAVRISCYYHYSVASILIDSKIITAVEKKDSPEQDSMISKTDMDYLAMGNNVTSKKESS